MERYDEHDGNSSFWEAITSPCGSSAQLFQHAGEDGGANESGVPLSIRGGRVVPAVAEAPVPAVPWLLAVVLMEGGMVI